MSTYNKWFDAFLKIIKLPIMRHRRILNGLPGTALNTTDQSCFLLVRTGLFLWLNVVFCFCSGFHSCIGHAIVSQSFWRGIPFLTIICREADSRSHLITMIHDATKLSVELSPSWLAGSRAGRMTVHINDVHVMSLLCLEYAVT